MSSTSKCPYCEGIVKSSEKNCPHCGATNELYVVDAPKVILTPHTIEELQEYCAERGMPLQRMRFFIGEDYKKPKAFGIYKETDGTIVVYKNKDTGERAIRYRGPDEEHGVKEIYLKLLDECHKRNIWPDTPDGKRPKEYKGKVEGSRGCLFAFISMFVIIFAIPIGFIFVPSNIIDSIMDSMIPTGILLGIPLGIHTAIASYATLYLCYSSIKKIEFETVKKKCLWQSIIPGVAVMLGIVVYTYIHKETPFKMAADTSWLMLALGIIAMPIIGCILLVVIQTIFSKTVQFIEKNFGKIICIVLILSLFINALTSSYAGNHPNGYYVKNDTVYYKQGTSVYTYNDYDSSWERNHISLDYDDYYGYSYDYELADDWDISYSDRFESTSEYDDYHNSSSSGDSSSSYDSWDSSDTDWGSDW